MKLQIVYCNLKVSFEFWDIVCCPNWILEKVLQIVVFRFTKASVYNVHCLAVGNFGTLFEENFFTRDSNYAKHSPEGKIFHGKVSSQKDLISGVRHLYLNSVSLK